MEFHSLLWGKGPVQEALNLTGLSGFDTFKMVIRRADSRGKKSGFIKDQGEYLFDSSPRPRGRSDNMEKETLNISGDAYDKYLLVRKKERPRARDLIPRIFDKFIPYHEGFPQDPNILAGFAELDGHPLFLIGQNWRTVKGRKILSTITAKGYALALEIMKLAEKRRTPLVTIIDTPGGDPLEESAKLLQCWKISDCIYTLAGLKVPTVSVIIGEGGSGGALALQVTDRTYMLENAVYSVISPEGCARILVKGLSRKPREERQVKNREMANLLRPTPQDMMEFGIIDGIIKEPEKGAHADHGRTAKNIKNILKKTLSELRNEPLEILLNQRYQRFMRYGQWQEEPEAPRLPFRKRLARKFTRRIKKIFKRKIKQAEEPKVDSLPKADDKIQKRVFTCPNKNCGAKTPFKKFLKNLRVCPKCGYLDRTYHPSAYDWIGYLVDRGSFEEKDKNLSPLDPLEFSYVTKDGQIKKYAEDLKKDQQKTGVNGALIIGTAKIKGIKVVLAVSEYGIRGGSLSSVVGEKFVRAVEYANKSGFPLVSVSLTGGARMQEGIFSLMQMAKTNMALTKIKVPYVSILADPTMAGSLSSYVSQGDIHLAETNAEIGFAGTRVVEGYLKTRIRDREGHSPPWYSAPFYLEKGGINEIVPRKKMRDRVHEYLELLRKYT